MIRFGARASLIFLIVTFALAAIRVGMPGGSAATLRLDALDPGACPMPCWLGLRPGVTSMREAVRLLLANPYIDPTSIEPLSPNGGASFKVRWRTPDAMLTYTRAATTDLTIDVEGTPDGRVKVIFIAINIPLGDFVMRFGPPRQTGLLYIAPNRIFYVLEYPEWGLQYDTPLECRRGQHLETAYGGTYVLQGLDSFVSQVSGQVANSWRGFDNRALDGLVAHSGCP